MRLIVPVSHTKGLTPTPPVSRDALGSFPLKTLVVHPVNYVWHFFIGYEYPVQQGLKKKHMFLYILYWKIFPKTMFYQI